MKRLESLPLRLEPVSGWGIQNSNRGTMLLFSEELLLIASGNWGYEPKVIVAFRVSGNSLTDMRVILYANAGVKFGAWAFAGDRLILYDYLSDDLLIYTLM